MKKRISFVNPNFQVGPSELNAYYLPYTVGMLWSYVSQFESITNNYELGEFIWKRESISEVVDRLKNDDIVGFSTYIWNRNYNYKLAEELKKANPNIIILFGGPEPPIEKSDIYEKFPFIDITVVREGEHILKHLLEAINTNEVNKVRGLLINDNKTPVSTGIADRITDLDEIPSPYLSGLFDHLIEKNPDVMWNTVIETNRGCPYQCTYCDWGSLTYAKIKKFDEQRVYDEIEWTGKNGFDFISFTDANFGIFEDRDYRIAEKLVETQLKYKNPKNYTLSWAKNQKQSVVDIAKLLATTSPVGMNLSVQTLDETALDAVRRKNLKINKIQDVFDIAEKNNIPVFTELILGLPGETLESWKENFNKLFKLNNHTGITVYQCQLLENAEMNLKQRESHDIKTVEVFDYISGTFNPGEIRESIEVVVSTKEMPLDKMLDAQVYSWFINTFHINGLTNFISRYLYKTQNIEYSEFYDRLIQFSEKYPNIKEEIDTIRKNYNSWMTEGEMHHEPLAHIPIHGVNLIHSTIMKLHFHSLYDEYFNFVEDFLKQFNLNANLSKQLIEFQKLCIVDYNKIKEYPIIKKFDYDFLGYITEDSELESTTTFNFEFPENKNVPIERFIEQIFFYRRRNFGKTRITTIQ